jgi:NAD(P)-dependent dehydrogenase (short-subunit alcohol dehydrogenase family)
MTRVTSPFGWESTAEEVSEGHDLTGKRAIVTGATAGLGVETARVLALRGAEVVLAVRDLAAAEPVVAMIGAAGGKARISPLDLSDLRSVEAFAAREVGAPLHYLINNAGIMACPLGRTAQGFENQLGINHIAHFHLTTLLLPALKAARGARVVAVSSSGHHWGAFDFDDPNFERTEYDPLAAYGRSKSANVLFAVELDRRFKGDGIRAFALMPGGIQTSLGRYMTDDVRQRLGTDPEAAKNIRWKTVAQGSATTIWAALGRELEGKGGLYLEDCNEALPNQPGARNGVKPWALDPEQAKRLWTWTGQAIAAVSLGERDEG